MANYVKRVIFALVVLVLVLSTASPPLGTNFITSAAASASASSNGGKVPEKLAIIPSEQGVNIGEISSDSINITSGDTYIYTVDTAEGAGRTRMAINTVEELLDQITS